jgi:ABC-type lipoprotein export system ATPase subunit
MSVLEMRQVSRTYGQGAAEVHALAGVDLSVDAGGMVAVMGPTGSGKSTLLTIAGSLENPTSGEVVVAGQTTSRYWTCSPFSSACRWWRPPVAGYWPVGSRRS